MTEENEENDWFERTLRDDDPDKSVEAAADRDRDDPERIDESDDLKKRDGSDGRDADGGSEGLGEHDGSDGRDADDGSETDGARDTGIATDDRLDLDGTSDRRRTDREFGIDETTGDEDGSPFPDDFASELEDVEMPAVGETEGFADIEFELGGAGETDFDEEIDSELPRVDLGIEGLDRMIQGGVPERSLMAVIGSAGTGKTTFGLQFLEHGLERGERAVFVTLEESRQRVIDSATEKGYAFDEYADAGDLAVVDVDPVEMANSLASIRSELPALIEDFGASRLVLDSVSLLEMMYEDRAKRRNEIYDFTRGLKDAGVTALLTSEASADAAYASRYGIVEYLTDAVFVLQYVRPDDFRETRLAVEIQKIRDANHSREKKPYEITGEGISVYQQANLF